VVVVDPRTAVVPKSLGDGTEETESGEDRDEDDEAGDLVHGALRRSE
jgi:hypothetical protein